MRLQTWFGMIVVLALLLAACQSTDNGADLIDDGESQPAFRIGGKIVTIADFQNRLREDIGPGIEQMMAQGQTVEQITALAEQQNVRQAIFEQMIQEELLLQVAREEGVGVDSGQIDEQLAMVPQPDAQEDDVDAFAEATQQRVDTARMQIATNMVVRHTTADMFNSRHILVETEETADQIIADLENGASFTELAGEYSQDPGSKDAGGELGWVTNGSFVPEFEEAAWSTELNTLVKVQSQFGWHIIEVIDRQEDRPFDDLDQLREHLQSAQMRGIPSQYELTFIPWYEQLRSDVEANGDLEISEGFDPDDVPLPFPETDER